MQVFWKKESDYILGKVPILMFIEFTLRGSFLHLLDLSSVTTTLQSKQIITNII